MKGPSAIHPYDHGFGTVWNEVSTRTHAGFSTSVTDYHEHGFYEINLILSGNVRILVGDRSEEGTGSRIVPVRPGTPHFISCKPDTLYRRKFLCFSEAFVSDCFPEWATLSRCFSASGISATLSEAETERFSHLIDEIEREPVLFRKKLLIYYFLSLLSEVIAKSRPESEAVPAYVVEALRYLEEHYAKRIVASALAEHLHIGRTALLTAFRRYTDRTLGEYLTQCRLRHAVRLLKSGETLEATAAACGFSDSSGLVRAFRRAYGMTPKAYTALH